MNKLLSIILFLLITSSVIGQTVARVDKKTKELTVEPSQKQDYRVFRYQLPGANSQKMICFSSHETDVRDNYSKCPLGSYFDTDRMKQGDKIIYLGNYGTFGKMNYVSASTGKKTLFYLPKSSFVIK